MRKTILVLITAVFASSLVIEGVLAQKRGRGVSITTGGDGEITRCEQIKIEFGGVDALRSELTQTVPRSVVSTLRVKSSQQGGVQVIGWNGNDYTITACLAVSADDTEARALLDRIRLSVNEGQVLVEGPSPRDWIAYLIIRAPNGTSLDLDSHNGPIGVRDFSGTVQSRSTNGPVSFRGVTGEIKADVQNGPVDVNGSGGDFRLNVQNGPLTVVLDGNHWSGELEGHTQNGPLTLKVPENYSSSIRVDASKHSPVECRAIQCEQAARTWDQPNVIQFGGSSPVIRLSTVNGPVTIKSSGESR